MYKNKKISVVIPCYNEEKGIAHVIKNMSSLVDEILIVDNDSTDNTSEVARNLGAKVVFEKKRGYGQAYKRGIPLATGDIIVTMDGDGSYPVEEIPSLIEFMLKNEIDFVSANRFPLEEKNSMNFMNKVGNKILTFATMLLFLKRITDSQSGMWIFKREVYQRLRLKSNGMSFSEEIKIEANLNKDTNYAEFHINYHKRIGTAKLHVLKHGFENIVFLFKKKIWR